MGIVGGGQPRSLYDVLGIRQSASPADVRKAYKKLAMKWHPDKWRKDKLMEEEAKRRFQDIQKAYQVLSDRGKRALYDMGFYDEGDVDEDDDEEEVEGFDGFLEEMRDLMSKERREGKKTYSIGELCAMLQDMGVSFA